MNNGHRGNGNENDTISELGSGTKMLDFVRWVLPLIVASLVAYFTAHAAIQTKVAVIEERESNHWMQIQAALLDLQKSVDRTNAAIERHSKEAAEQAATVVTPQGPVEVVVPRWQIQKDQKQDERIFKLEQFRVEIENKIKDNSFKP